MANAMGLLAVWMEIPTENEADLNEWYTKEHLPERKGIPGFQSALRYISLTGSPKYMALYDLDTTDVLYSEAYKDLRKNSTDWTRRIGRALVENIRNEHQVLHEAGHEPSEPAPFALLVRSGQDEENPESEASLRKAVDMAGAVPGVIRARVYKAAVGSPKYLAYIEFAHQQVRFSDAWRNAEQSYAEVLSGPVSASNYGRVIEASQ